MILTRDRAHILSMARSRVVAVQAAPSNNPLVSRAKLADGTYVDTIHIKPVYYETKRGDWRPLAEIAAHHGNKRLTLLPTAVDAMSWRFLAWLMNRQRALGSELRFGYPHGIYAGVQPRDLAHMQKSLAFSPDASPETTTCDGYAEKNYISCVASFAGGYADCRNITSADTTDDSGATLYVGTKEGTGGTLRYGIARSFLTFNTAALDDARAIDQAIMRVYLNSKINGENDGSDYLSLVQSTQASNTAVAADDINDRGTTEGSDTIDIGNMTASAWNILSLNATGIGWISKTGVTKLALCEGHDTANDTPSNDTTNEMQLASADSANDPVLVAAWASVSDCVSGAA